MNKEELKYCKFCDREKPKKEFCKSGGFVKNICRECQNKKQRQMYQDSKKVKELGQEIDRLNNIIKRLEEDLREMYLTFGEFSEEYTEKKLKELKENNNE